MYSSYSPLQRTQLSGQVYTDTQSLYLLVYAPGRRVALENTLRDQLHQKFRLVDSLADALTPAVAGVLLVREDVELMSTALNYFAAALKDGADLVLSDAVFGYNGATALYQSDAHISCTGCALVSRAFAGPLPRRRKGPGERQRTAGRCRPPAASGAPASHRLCSILSETSAPRMPILSTASGHSSSAMCWI